MTERIHPILTSAAHGGYSPCIDLQAGPTTVTHLRGRQPDDTALLHAAMYCVREGDCSVRIGADRSLRYALEPDCATLRVFLAAGLTLDICLATPVE
jgi:hypothetical protein